MIHVIVGPPCCGKSTYVREHAKPDDLIIDYDIIAQALGAKTTHRADGLIRKAAFAAREAAITVALKESWQESWLIHSIPSATQMDLYKSVGAEIVVLDPGYEVVIARAKKDGRPTNTYDGIQKWYARKTEILEIANRKKGGTSEAAIMKDITNRQIEHLRMFARTGDIGSNSRKW